MTCEIKKIDSNVTNLAFAEEECLKQLPTTPIWYDLEPNSYSDFGGDTKTVNRSPITISRQNKKGAVVDVSAAGGFNIDFTKSNLTRLLQGFFFADAHELPSTAPLNAAAVPIDSATSGTKTYALASGGDAFIAGDIVLASGFENAATNGIKTVASSTSATIVVNEAITTEAAPPAIAKIEKIGIQFTAEDIAMAKTGNILSLVSTTTDFTDFTELFPGQWIFIGGDATGKHFVNNVGYARIGSISANAIIFDDTTFAGATEAKTGLTIQIFVGTCIKNENTIDTIIRRSYQLERQLGLGVTDVQAEYLEGAVPNESKLNIPSADKITMDLSFTACNQTFVTGDGADVIKTGNHVSILGESAINTSSDIYRMKLAVLDPLTSVPSSLFGYVSEGSISIKNAPSENKAVGTVGAFDISVGNFEVSGSLTVYFSTVAAVAAVRNNADVGFSVIGAFSNAGFIYDIPLLSLGGGKLTVDKDKPIMLPLTSNGAENANGYTMLFESFKYLPTLAMPE